MNVCVVVVADYAAIYRGQCVPSASSCRSWRKGGLERVDLGVALNTRCTPDDRNPSAPWVRIVTAKLVTGAGLT